jgi:hypothetical protein
VPIVAMRQHGPARSRHRLQLQFALKVQVYSAVRSPLPHGQMRLAGGRFGAAVRVSACTGRVSTAAVDEAADALSVSLIDLRRKLPCRGYL